MITYVSVYCIHQEWGTLIKNRTTRPKMVFVVSRYTDSLDDLETISVDGDVFLAWMNLHTFPKKKEQNVWIRKKSSSSSKNVSEDFLKVHITYTHERIMISICPTQNTEIARQRFANGQATTYHATLAKVKLAALRLAMDCNTNRNTGKPREGKT